MRYFNIFIEMAVTEIVFFFKLERRNRFYIRLPVTLIIFALVSWSMKYADFMPYDWAWMYSFLPLFLGIAFSVICYKIGWLKAICFGIIAYAIQHTAYVIHLCVISLSAYPMIYVTLVDYAFYIAVLFVYWVMFARKLNIEQAVSLKNAKAVGICIFMLIMTYLVNFFIHSVESVAELLACIGVVCIIFLSFNVLFGYCREDIAEKETEEVKRILEREQALHKISKENIELINIKCHDLKRMLYNADGAAVDGNCIKEIENAISLYDGSIRTGNDDLDLIIAEKNVRCIKDGIKLACMIDGAKLGFMTSGDLYSFFGNAIDNAIEYLARIDDKAKRIINVNVRQKGAFIGICVENYCEDKLVFENGLPVTTKSDKNFHGFGTKSMRYIVEKYGGSISFEVCGRMFTVNIIFPAELSG